MPSIIDQYPIVRPTSRLSWRSWLRRRHREARGVWVVYTKRSAGRQPLSYDGAVQEALCFGWIDSVIRTIDDRSYRQLFTPRKPRSTWSAPNKRRMAALIKSGRMTEAGMAAVRTAKRNGSWSALTKVDRLAVPPDMVKAWSANPRARDGFEKWSVTIKRAALWWLQTAKTDATRRARLREIMRSASRGRKPRPMRAAS